MNKMLNQLKTIAFSLFLISQYSFSSTGTIRSVNLPLLISSPGINIHKSNQAGIITNIEKISRQTQISVFNKDLEEKGVEVYRIHILNYGKKYIEYNINHLKGLHILDKYTAFNMAEISHKYISDIILYFGISSIITFLGWKLLNNDRLTVILSVLSIDTSSFKRYALLIAAVPPIIKTIINVYDHASEYKFFKRYYLKNKLIHPDDGLTTFIFAKTHSNHAWDGLRIIF